ncbi:hypothetical protein MTO96_040752 [Rhipicephalus appendiculatus]
MYTARHNAVVARLRKAAAREFTVAFENRPDGDTGLRPDLVLVRGAEALILDVACPFENTPEAFSNARNDKMAKYEPVAVYLRRRYQRVTVGAVIVGALGPSLGSRQRSRPAARLLPGVPAPLQEGVRQRRGGGVSPRLPRTCPERPPVALRTPRAINQRPPRAYEPLRMSHSL